MKKVHILLLAVAVIVASCNKEPKKNSENNIESEEKSTMVDEHGHTVAVDDQDKVPEGLDTKNTGDPVLETGAPETEKEDPNKKPDVVSYKDALANVSFTDTRLDVVFKHYIEMKTAMVNGDVNKVADATSYLMMGYANFGVDEAVLRRANDIVDAKDIETQRQLLPGVTEDVAAMIEGNIKSGKIYRIYCPMAFDNTGGQWLSQDKTIENPYFGDAMLNCGSVQETLK
ncbi:DUF3347 domain-containing protein [Flavobacteriaceae bacterium M23B6Z8]